MKKHVTYSALIIMMLTGCSTQKETYRAETPPPANSNDLYGLALDKLNGEVPSESIPYLIECASQRHGGCAVRACLSLIDGLCQIPFFVQQGRASVV
ncbi:hypothetical protein [Pleionea sp. CnH1-48]|uniref:hypothetical protein n=1 Tax=Pleionea sp. CnH1-48 TaxID=2954494 RepID=UPI002096E7A5|nr:hypothetical protein [Pleionea sp. CnH1-48]MCO7224002.1 hypothetical protein [Pleionea sp. CnH1-48]